jgi:hypothetical protein
MTSPGGADGAHRPEPPHRADTGWTVLGYLITGMALYGGIGALVGHWLHVPILFPLGMLLGLGLATAMIIFRFGRS